MFFRTDTYPELLKDKEVQLIIVAPKGKIDFYKREYGTERVIFEPLDIMDEHPLGKKLVRLAFNLLPTSTIRGKQRLYLHRYGKYHKFLILRALNYTIGYLPFVKEIIRAFDRFVPLDDRVVKIYEKYKPDIVFIPDIIFGPDRIFARAAKRKGIYIIGTPRSWDNLTSKGFAIIKPDKLLVLTSRMIPEAQKYVGMKNKDIIVTGPPQFDIYFKESKTTKEDFCRKLGIPSDRRIILTAPFFDPYTGSAVCIINELTSAINDGRLPKDSHILVRYRPATPLIKESVLNKSDHLTITNPCSLSFEVHDLVSPKQDFEWTYDDVELLINSLKFSDTVINIVSTLSIDAMIFDKPVINIRFDADSNCPSRHSVNIMLQEHDHFKAIEATGGVRLAWNMNELIDLINRYLSNPKLDFEKREILRKEQIEFFDGLAGKRVADFIKNTLNYLEAFSRDFTYTENNSDIAGMPS